MEALPKLPMICFQAKTSPENVDFATKLKQLISEKFGENPSAFAKEIKEFETLRANACIRVAETIEGVATLKKYYCQLIFLKNRFKIGVESPFQFSWRDVYSGAEFAFPEISYELASVLYNIGSLHTRLGFSESREESEGMKMAVAHFQCAAWAFHTLPDLYPQDVECDLCADLMGFKSQVSLAQAQECILEKSILDSRKPLIISKVGGQVVEYYKQALKSLQTSNTRDHGERIIDIVGNKLTKTWTTILEFKVGFYNCISWLHMGMCAEENKRMGERVTYYQAASDCLAECGKLSKKLDAPFRSVSESLAYAHDVVNGKLDNAKKENEFIYHEKVPELDSLQEIKGASLVKGIAFAISDPEVSGPDIFHRLVPMEAHEASSLYSEEQAKLLRTVLSETESANGELTVYMSALQLDDIPSEEEHNRLPQELVECAAGLSVRNVAVAQLQEGMASLASVSADVEASLTEVQRSLKEEKAKQTEFQDIVGPRPSSIIAELEKETQKYQEAHSMASESNLTLNKAMRLHVKNLQLLSKPLEELDTQIPKISDLEETVLQNLRNMKSMIAKVGEMQSQRQKLVDDLREAIRSDDITSSLAKKGNKDNEKVFQEEIKKHEKTVEYIRQNIMAQANILSALTEKNAEYASAREAVAEFVRERTEKIGSLVASYHAYEDLLDKATKGLEFYSKLEKNVNKLLSRVDGVVKVQEEEREQLLSSNTKKIADARELSLRLIAGQNTPYSPVKKAGETGTHDYKVDFAPGAPPPPETTDPPPAQKAQRPKLIDYLKARKEASSEDKTEGPGIRPQPLGSEAEPAYAPHSLPSGMQQQGFGMPGYRFQVPHAANPPGMYQADPQFAHYYAQSLNMMRGYMGQNNLNVSNVQMNQGNTVAPLGNNMIRNHVSGPPSYSGTFAGQGPSNVDNRIQGLNQSATGKVGIDTNIVSSQPSDDKSCSQGQPSMAPDQGKSRDFIVENSSKAHQTQSSVTAENTPPVQNLSNVGPRPIDYLQSGNSAVQPKSYGGYFLPPTNSNPLPGQNNPGQQYPHSQMTGSRAFQDNPVHGNLVQPPQSNSTESKISQGSNVNNFTANITHKDSIPQQGVGILSRDGGLSQLPPSNNAGNLNQMPYHPSSQSNNYAEGKFISHLSGSNVQMPPTPLQPNMNTSYNFSGVSPNTSAGSSSNLGAFHTQTPAMSTTLPTTNIANMSGMSSNFATGSVKGSSDLNLQHAAVAPMSGTPLPHVAVQPNINSKFSTGNIPTTTHGISMQHPNAAPNFPSGSFTGTIPVQNMNHPKGPSNLTAGNVPGTSSVTSMQHINVHPNFSTNSLAGAQVVPNVNHPSGPSHVPIGVSNVQKIQPQSTAANPSARSMLGTNVQSVPNQVPSHFSSGNSAAISLMQNAQHSAIPNNRNPGTIAGVASVAGIQQSYIPSLHASTVGAPSVQSSQPQNLNNPYYRSGPGMPILQHTPYYNQTNHPNQNLPTLANIQTQGYVGHGQCVQQAASCMTTNAAVPGQMLPQRVCAGVTVPSQYQLPNASSQISVYGQISADVNKPVSSTCKTDPISNSHNQLGTHEVTPSSTIATGQSNQSNLGAGLQTNFQVNQVSSNSAHPGVQLLQPKQDHGLSRTVMHPVVPQPGTQNTERESHSMLQSQAKATSNPQTSVVSDAAAVSNLDLLVGIDLNSPQRSITSTSALASLVVDSSVKDECKESKQIIQSNISEKQKPVERKRITTEKLVQETQKLQNVTSSLSQKTLKGSLPIDTMWKEVVDSVEKCGKKLSVSVARCYPMKNRAPDILPYDQTRIELKNTKDDYINASLVSLPQVCPDFIVTQLPLKGEVTEFISLIWQEGVETMMSMVPVAEMFDGKYVPDGRDPMMFGDYSISTQSLKEMPGCKERVLNITNNQTKQTRAVLHLELTTWLGPDMPSSPGPLLQACQLFLDLYNQQRSPNKPVLVHCRDGGNKSATMCALTAAIGELENNASLVDLSCVFSNILQARKGFVRDKLYLRFAHDALLYYLQSKLIQLGVISGVTGGSRTHSRHPSQDFVSGSLSIEVSAPRNTESTANVNAETEENPSSEQRGDSEQLEQLTNPASEQRGDSEQLEQLTNPASEQRGDSEQLEQLTNLANLSVNNTPKKKRITKEDFLNPSGNLSLQSDPSDPLSQLNPLWSMK